DPRENGPRYPDRVQQLVSPVHSGYIHEHGPARVRHIGDVLPGEVPDQPGIHRAEEDLTRLGAATYSRIGVEEPADLRAGEVCGEREPGSATEPILPLLAGEIGDQTVGARVLPHDCVADGLARATIPQNSRLALVGDPDRGQVGTGDTGPFEGVHYV